MGDEGKAGADLSDQAIEWLVALDCGTADTRAFEAWRNASSRNAAAFAQVAATWRRTADQRLSVLLDQPDDAPAPVAEEPVPAPAAPAMVSRRAVAAGFVATALGLGAAGTFLAWPRRAHAATAVGERRTIHLPDGSRALLNTDTRVAWRFDEGRDFWVERGEAALFVRDAARPFRLYSDPVDARLSGGRFNLRIDPAGGRLMVLEGRAAAAYRGTLAETIRAGSVLTVRDGTAQVAALSPDAATAATAWQHGRILFNGMALDQALAEFNRYLPRRIVLQDPGLAATRLGGEFQIADPDGFLLALREGFDIDHREQGDRILLYRRK